MKINLDSATFGNRNIRYHDKTHNIMETYDERNNLIKRVKYDKQCKDVDCIEFDDKKQIISHQHKKYTNNGCIETYKSKSQEYIREIKIIVKDSFTHHFETYTSKTSPQNNYVNEFIRDIEGKLVKMINNGKVIDLK